MELPFENQEIKERERRVKLLIEKGYTCNPDTGDVFGMNGKKISRKHKKGYTLISNVDKGKQHNVLGHQFIFFWVNGYCAGMIDHINMNKGDNRICNLRETTQQKNSFNTNYAKGYSKVTRGKKVKYEARIKLNYKSIYLGGFNSEEEASNAYIQAKKKYHL